MSSAGLAANELKICDVANNAVIVMASGRLPAEVATVQQITAQSIQCFWN